MGREGDVKGLPRRVCWVMVKDMMIFVRCCVCDWLIKWVLLVGGSCLFMRLTC